MAKRVMKVGDSSHSTSMSASIAKIPPSFSCGSSLLMRSKMRLFSSVTNAVKFSRDSWRASISTALRRSCMALRFTCSRRLRRSESARSTLCDSCMPTRGAEPLSFFEVIACLSPPIAARHLESSPRCTKLNTLASQPERIRRRPGRCKERRTTRDTKFGR